MNERKGAGFRELDHTADVELQVWGPDLAAMLEQAARGMYSLAGIKLKAGTGQMHRLELPMTDRETLLVNYLSELLFLLEIENIAFDSFEIELNNETMNAEMYGLPLESQIKHIKAVTYHNLVVHQGLHGFEARIVFDV
jgi:SHS2 domain-containing protein